MDAYLIDAVRTPRGKARPDGGLASLSPQELVRQLHAALLQRQGAAAPSPDALLLGCVGQVGSQGGHLALVAKLHLGLPDATSALTLNNYCVSGLTAIGQAAALVQSGQAERVLAGGVEMMSQVGFMADRASYYGDMSFSPRTRYLPVALAADRLAAAESVGRADLDAVALMSQLRAAQASARLQRSRIPITRADGSLALAHDECVRGQTTAEGLAAMAPAFAGLAGDCAAALDGEQFRPLHTVSHAPPMCDGAALALIGHQRSAGARARIVAFAEAGGDPAVSLLAGLAAMDLVLARAGLNLAQMDRIEFMEAFGVTLVKFLRDWTVDPARVNVGGGHLAKGHPLGASGAILVSTLLDALDEADGRYGLVVCSGASGVGAAMIVERLP
ncbi:MAG: acetyl-CoA C-acyltransferase [Burkholderiaceae bacterium]|nr:acetyl-CoA C-acyltransferase [Burkholderiaceae bacterium]MBT9500623.1 acetyl-CoA C-acyltransferase [Burkholderiaceae bacterium]